MRIVHALLLLILCVLMVACGPPKADHALSSIFTALEPVASGAGVPEAAAYAPDDSRPHLFVILEPSGAPHAWNYHLPITWWPQALSETELVIVIGE